MNSTIVGKLSLTLYVAGSREPAGRAERRFRRMLDALGLEYELELVDILQDPLRAERDGILAVPTMIRHAPDPPRRLIGDLRSPAALALAIGPA